MKVINLSQLKRISNIFFLTMLVTTLLTLVLSCSDNIADSGKEKIEGVEMLEPGLFSVNGDTMYMGANSNIDSDMWLVAGSKSGEKMAALAKRDESGNAVLYGAVYSDSSGNGFTVILKNNGRPDSVAFSDGSTILFSGYTAQKVTLTSYSPAGDKLGTEIIDLNSDFKLLASMVEEYGLTFSDLSPLEKRTAGLAIQGKLSGWSLLLKFTSTSISSVACIVGFATSPTGVGVALATAGCISAAQGLGSMITYITDDDTLSDQLGTSSAIWGAFACPTGDIASCLTTAIALLDNIVAGCRAESNLYTLGCKDGWVTSFDECGMPYKVVKECPCGCVNAACIPIAACSSASLAINIRIGAAPPCDSIDQYIFFTADVFGGDPDSYTYNWNFGDGGSGVLKSESHAYSASGNYVATLLISDSDGNFGFSSMPVEIGTCSKVSELIIGSNKECAEINKTVSFSSLANGGDKWTYKYLWHFGDGVFSKEPNPSHKYTSNGTYNVTTFITDADGGRAMASLSQKIGNCPTAIDVTISTETACADTGESVTFVSDVYSEGYETVDYIWDFGDGATSTEAFPSHKFKKSGTYTISLEVTDYNDSTATHELSLKVGGCDGPIDVSMSGTVLYTTLDITTQPPYERGLRTMDLGTLETQDISIPDGEIYIPLGVADNGTIVMAETDGVSGDFRLMSMSNWGAGSPFIIGTDCGDSGVSWSWDNQVGVTSNGTVFFNGNYDSTYYDTTREKNLTIIKHGMMQLPASFLDCRFTPVDFDGDGDSYNEYWDDTDLGAGYTGSTIVFSRSESPVENLYTIPRSGGMPTFLTDTYHSSLQVSRDGSVCMFTMNDNYDFAHIAAMPTFGGSLVDLSAATGLTLMIESAALNFDGSKVVMWSMDMTLGILQMALINTDGSSYSLINTGDVRISSSSPSSFTPDETGLIFIGSTYTNSSEAVGDIYHLDIESHTITNLTNTPDIHEDMPFVR